LFLDLDGTLAAFESVPQAVGPDTRRNGLLRRVADRLDGRLAVVSGRSIGEVDRILEGAVTAVAGLHGLERRSASGLVTGRPPHPRLEEARAALEAFVWRRPGLTLEDKGICLALHYRGAPTLGASALALVRGLALARGMVVQQGDCVVELRPSGPDKGDAIAAFLMEPPFIGGLPVFVGDDLTDEDGFRAAAAAGGLGVLVGRPRNTRATYVLPDVGAVIDWLEAELQPA
jgi:trehalose 6-phosphate phosphatase